MAFDPVSGHVFVANNGSNNVSVISTLTHSVVATVPVGLAPTGVAVDQLRGRVFVADHDSNQTTVISTTNDTVVANVTVGSGPYNVAWDPLTDKMFVTNEYSSNVSVINFTLLITNTIPVVTPSFSNSIDLQGIAYDPYRQAMWIGGGPFWAVVVNATEERVMWFLATDPSSVAVDNSTGLICMTNTYNSTFACVALNQTPIFGSATEPLTFNEVSGLTPGTPWSVTVGHSAPSQESTGTSINFDVWAGWAGCAGGSEAYDFSIPPVGNLYATPSNGTVYTTCNATVVDVTFSTVPTYPVTFQAHGLASGSLWSVALGPYFSSTTAPTDTIPISNGSYNFSIGPPPGFSANPANGTLTVAGLPVTVNVTFTPLPPSLSYWVTFSSSGLSPGTSWNIVLNNTTAYGGNQPDIQVLLPPGYYSYAVVPISGYTVSPGSGSFQLGNANLTIPISFFRTSVAPYALLFTESGLRSGTLWSVAVNGTTTTTNATALAFLVPAGVYGFVVGSVPGYLVAPSSGTVHVVSNTTVTIGFEPMGPPPFEMTYAVSFSATGLTVGTQWGVSVNSTALTTNGTAVDTLLANGTYGFVVHPPNGYVATPSSGGFSVNGGPLIIAVSFTQLPPSGSGGSGSGVNLSDLVLVAAVGAAAGAVTGVVAGLLIGRRPPAGSTSQPKPPSSS